MTTRTQHGWLFDLYARGTEMVLWFIADDGARVRAADRSFALTAYLDGPRRDVDACLRALAAAGDGEPLGPRDRLDFWTGGPRRVEALRVTKLEAWRRLLDRYAARFPAVSWYNADLLPEQVYCYERDLFPLGRCGFEVGDGGLLAVRCEDDRWDTDYASIPVRRAGLEAAGSLLGRRPRLDSLTLTAEGRSTTWDEPSSILPAFQDALDLLDPDVLVTRGGDAFVFPLLLTMAARAGFALRPDREDPPQPREVRLEGRSYMSYGRVLYSAPECPLYGRWHIDADNSFMVRESGMEGLFEVTRVSRLPPQRIGRRSIGTGITSVQLDVAWRDGCLVPWKKTHPEAWKSAAQLLRTDRGGLVYAPEPGFYENVVELDFASMYPTIMARFNVSPETVNCPCCSNRDVPEIGYAICRRRRGLVSRALEPVIDKRQRYKALRAAAGDRGDADARRRFDERQTALKWMLVCCFGYLGYRNARFGRIEAHEAVSAFSREMLVRAREVCEDAGWRMIHANVDCVWIEKPGFRRGEVADLCRRIDDATGLAMALEGVYSWVAFLPSRRSPDRPVPTRYFGRFEDGSLKFRGIECRRGDLPAFVRRAQRDLLDLFADAPSREAFAALVPEARRRVAEWEGALWRHEVPLDELAIRGSLSRDPDEYRGNGRQALAARQSLAAGLNLHAGEALEYVITDARNPDRERRVRLAPLLDAETACDPVEYVRLLRRAANTVLWPAGVELDEKRIAPPWRRDASVPRRAPKPAAGQMDLFAV